MVKIQNRQGNSEVKPASSRNCFLIIIFATLVVTGVIVGLALGLKRQNASSPTSPSGNVVARTTGENGVTATGTTPIGNTDNTKTPSQVPSGVRFDGRLAALEPPTGLAYFGFHLNWNLETPVSINSKIGGAQPVIFNAFLEIGNPVDYPQHYKINMLTWHAEQVRNVGGILELTLQPFEIETLPQAAYDSFAQHCARINRDMSVPILLRYGHEMNGNWATYGLKPTAYKESFIRMSNAIKAVTKLTGYPFGGTLVGRSAADRAALDTNRNNILDENDDPYLAFYPGDQHVDWVGLSTYWYYCDITPIDNFFAGSLTDSQPGMSNAFPDRNFYNRFARDRNKPMIIPETGSPVCYSAGSRPTVNFELQTKRGWWSQLLSNYIRINFPRVKAITYFEEAKFEGGFWKDWRVTVNDTIRPAFVTDLNNARNLFLWANNLYYNQNGSVGLLN